MKTRIQSASAIVASLFGHAFGTQNYVCLPSGNQFAFKLFTPQATLFDDDGKQMATHFFSPHRARRRLYRTRLTTSSTPSAPVANTDTGQRRS